MDNLIELIGKQLTPDVVNALGSLSGTTSAQTQNALKAAVPSLVGVLAQRGATPAGAEGLLDLIGKQTGSDDMLGNLVGMLGNSRSSENLLSQGAGILGSLLGGNTSKVIDVIASIAGIKGGSATSLLKSLAPVALALLGKQVSGRKLNATGLADLLGGQMDFVKSAAPEGLTDMLDFAALSPEPEKFNLIDLIGKQLTPDVVNALGSLGGTTPAQTQNALGAIVPSLVGALANRSATRAGAEGLLDLVGKQTGSDDMLGNLVGMLGNSRSSENLLSQGAGILGSLLGGNTSKVIDVIASIAGIKGGSATSLLKSLAPVALALLGKQVSGRKLNATGLADLLGGQMDLVKSVAPKGLTDVLDFAPVEVSAATPATPRVTPPAAPSPRLNPQPEPPSPERSMKWLWWLLGIAALLALLWFLFLRPKPVTIQALPANLQAPVCTAITTLDTTVKGLPTIDANTTVADLQAGRDKVKTAFDGVVNVLATARPAEAKTIQTAYNTYSDLVSGITGSTVGASAQKVTSARQALVDAEGKLLQGYNCK